MFGRNTVAAVTLTAALALTLTAPAASASTTQAAPTSTTSATTAAPAALAAQARKPKRPAYCTARARHLSAHQRYMCRHDLRRHLAHKAYVKRIAREKAAAKARAKRAARHAHSARARVVATAASLKGIPYRWGGTTRRGFDCSGYTQYVYKKVGVHLLRKAADQARQGHATSRPRPGDLVTWGSPAYHVGIYAGRGRAWVARHTGTFIGIQRIWGHPAFRSIFA